VRLCSGPPPRRSPARHRPRAPRAPPARAPAATKGEIERDPAAGPSSDRNQGKEREKEWGGTEAHDSTPPRAALARVGRRGASRGLTGAYLAQESRRYLFSAPAATPYARRHPRPLRLRSCLVSSNPSIGDAGREYNGVSRVTASADFEHCDCSSPHREQAEDEIPMSPPPTKAYPKQAKGEANGARAAAAYLRVEYGRRWRPPAPSLILCCCIILFRAPLLILFFVR